jgi:hypothetical protein
MDGSLNYKEVVMGLLKLGLPTGGWRLGECEYCHNAEFKYLPEVMVHKLPNGIRACMKCFKRPEPERP